MSDPITVIVSPDETSVNVTESDIQVTVGEATAIDPITVTVAPDSGGVAVTENNIQVTVAEALRGAKGDKGDTGDDGAQGPAGNDGATGPKGDDGDAGPTGPAGNDGDDANAAGSTGDIQVNSGGSFVAVKGLRINTTGNARGTNSLDIQTKRSNAGDVAQSDNCLLIGGNNKNGDDFAFSDPSESVMLGWDQDTIAPKSVLIGVDNEISDRGFFVPKPDAGGVAIGFNNDAAGNVTEFGGFDSNFDNHTPAIVIGRENDALGMQNIILGANSETNGRDSISVGNSNAANGEGALAIGTNAASVSNATSIGQAASANAEFATAIGYRISAPIERSVVIGSGDSSLVTLDGKFSINNLSPQSAFHATGDILSTDISDLGAEIASDPAFDLAEADSPWAFGGNWSRFGGGIFIDKAEKSAGANGNLSQSLTGLVIGDYYLINIVGTFQPNSGAVVVSFTGSDSASLESFGNGTITTFNLILPATATSGNINILADSGSVGELRSVSVKKIIGGNIVAPVGSIVAGASSPQASAVIQADSTTQGFLPPRMTTTQRDAIPSPAEGLVIYNTTTKTLNFYNGTLWIAA